MSVATFIPEIWNARLLNALRNELVYSNLFNRNYEGEIAAAGDTVHINTINDITIKKYTRNTDIDNPEQLTTADQTLVVDQSDYFNFYLNDVDKAQALPGLVDASMQSAAHGLAEETDKYLAGLLAGVATFGATKQVTAANAYDLIVDLKVKLDKANVAKVGRKVVLPPEFEGLMLMDGRFVTGTKGEGRLEDGAVAKAAGFDIYISNNVPEEGGVYKIIATTNEGNTYAEQLLKTEAYRREKGFDDGVKGLHVYGAKVLRPSAVVGVAVTFGDA